MFLGQYTIALKNKNRLPLPAHFGAFIMNGAYAAQGFDCNVFVFTPDKFDEVYRRITSLNIADPISRLLMRMLLGTAAFLQADRNGCVSLPKHLLEYAQIKGGAVIVGQGDYFEVWSPDHWHKQRVEIEDAQSNESRFASLMSPAR